MTGYNDNIDVVDGKLDEDSRVYFASGFHYERLGRTPQRIMQADELRELQAELGISA